MSPATVLDFVNVFFAGILAGIEIVIHYGLRAPAEVLDEPSQIQLRQALVLRLRVLVPAFFLPTAVSVSSPKRLLRLIQAHLASSVLIKTRPIVGIQI